MLTELSVLWGDEDGFNHVNNVAYLRWCESARVDYLRRIDLFPDLPPSGVGPILANQACNYRRPLSYPDTVIIGTRVTSIRNSSFGMEHCIVSRTTGVIAAESTAVVVTIDYATGSPVRVPDSVRQAIARLEGRSFD